MVIYPAIKLRHIRRFLFIADSGTLSVAAQHLGLSQPALSKSLAETETLLGRALFLRQGRRLILTPEGEAFRRHVRQALISLDSAAMAFGVPSDPGTITIGLLPTVSIRFFPLVARRDHPASIDLGDVRPAVETRTLALGRGLLLTANAVWFISRGVVANELALGELITIDHGATYFAGAVGLVRLRGGNSGVSVERLVEMLRETAAHWAEA